MSRSCRNRHTSPLRPGVSPDLRGSTLRSIHDRKAAIGCVVPDKVCILHSLFSETGGRAPPHNNNVLHRKEPGRPPSRRPPLRHRAHQTCRPPSDWPFRSSSPLPLRQSIRCAKSAKPKYPESYRLLSPHRDGPSASDASYAPERPAPYRSLCSTTRPVVAGSSL